MIELCGDPYHVRGQVHALIISRDCAYGRLICLSYPALYPPITKDYVRSILGGTENS